MALGICWGVKVRGSARLRCGESVDDPRVVDEVNRLINEFISRVEKHKATLLSDSATPFDHDINALSDWLSIIAVGNGDDAIAMLRNTEREASEKILRLAEEARERWLKTYKPELEDLINRLQVGEAKIIISGDPLNKDKSFMAHLYTENLAIEITRVAKAGSITINISLTGLEGVNVAVPKLLDDNTLEAMQYGLLMTDGAINKKGYPTMSTNQLWQAIIFPLMFPNKAYINITSVSINNSNVNITWQLKANDYKNKYKSKTIIAKKINKLNNEKFLQFLLLAILGDGTIDIKKKRIKLNIGISKHKMWAYINERIKSLGFKKNYSRYLITYTVTFSKAVNLAREMLGNQLIRILIDDLSKLFNAEKLKRLITISNMEIKSLGRSSIEIIDGIKMSIQLKEYGNIELRIERKNYEDAKRIQELLKSAGCDAKLANYGKFFRVFISMETIREHKELAAKVCEILRRMHKNAIDEGNTERAWRIARAITKLSCHNPAQGL